VEAIYARQSVDKKDSLSIEGQIEFCARSAQGEYRVYQDKGFSGSNTNRPAFEQLLRDIEKGAIHKLYVYRLDRFSRSIADFSRIWAFLEKYEVQFESVTEKFDTSTPMGRAMLNIIMTFAQLERETIAGRVKDNYEHRCSLGAWPGGPAPIGFTIGQIQNEEGKHASTLIPNERMELVRRIFEAYAQDGASLGNIAKELNEAAIPGIKRKTWDNVALSRILRSPLYVMADTDVYLYYAGKGLHIEQSMEAFDGIHACNVVGKRNRSAGKYNDYSVQKLSVSNHFGVLPSELWLKCQYKLDGNQQLDRSTVGKHSWLSGLLKCGSCGYSVKINLCDGKYYLLCSGRSNLGLCDAGIRVNLRELEDAAEQEIRRLLSECPPEDYSNLRDGQPAGAVAAIEAKIGRLVMAIAESSDISIPYLNREIARLDKEKQRLLAERTVQKKREAAKQLQSLEFDKLSLEERKLVAVQFIDRILLQGDTAEVIWNI
jgi:DNA invertase Pin-like site-specific DNA recombinase